MFGKSLYLGFPFLFIQLLILLTFPNEIVLLIKDVLITNDDIWKYWCLEVLIKRLPEESRKLFKSDLIRLIERPTAGEKLEELDVTAIGILRMIG